MVEAIPQWLVSTGSAALQRRVKTAHFLWAEAWVLENAAERGPQGPHYPYKADIPAPNLLRALPKLDELDKRGRNRNSARDLVTYAVIRP
jgi:hypothetical protein